GVGKQMHEKPEIPNYGRKGTGAKLPEGLVICVEPMINLGTKEIMQESDGWTIRTTDRKPSAHFELEVAVSKDKVDVLTSYKEIEEVLNKKN
ncbi:MAG: type I methionyl aminopeptidase, partial [Bacteroidales bacterium]|nr:type I methionyl aminopeptidase [Bacteroidales bacterium]